MIIPIKMTRIKQRIPAISTAVLSSGISRKNGNQKLLLRARSSRHWVAWSRSAARNLFLTKTAMCIHTMFMMTAFSASSARREMNVLSEFSTSVTVKKLHGCRKKEPSVILLPDRLWSLRMWCFRLMDLCGVRECNLFCGMTLSLISGQNSGSAGNYENILFTSRLIYCSIF